MNIKQAMLCWRYVLAFKLLYWSVRLIGEHTTPKMQQAFKDLAAEGYAFHGRNRGHV